MAQRIPLDTCTFLWIIRDSPELSQTARNLFIDPENTIYLSAVSAWEISVKYRLGKLPLVVAPHIYVPAERLRHNILPLPMEEGAASVVSRRPPLHNDPFDRMLICQVVTHGLTWLSPDRLIHRSYSGAVASLLPTLQGEGIGVVAIFKWRWARRCAHADSTPRGQMNPCPPFYSV